MALPSGALERALARGADAAGRLAERLRSSRTAAEQLDLDALRHGLDQVTAEVEALRRLAGALGGLSDQARAPGPEAAMLASRLQEAAEEVASLSIVARHGAAVYGHLLGLRESDGGAAVYGPAGRLGEGGPSVGRRA